MSTRAPLLVALFAATTVACLVTRADDSSTEGAVQGGALDTTMGYAVGVRAGGSVCSGTLIAPNLVLTARHCIAEGPSDPVDCKRDRFDAATSPSGVTITTDARIGSGKGTHAVKSVFVPASDDHVCGADIALLVLADLVPSKEAVPATPVVRFPMTDKTRVGREVVVAGFGVTDATANDAGRRRVKAHVPILCVPGDLSLSCSLFQSDREFTTEGSVCFGDSGSGAYDQASVGKGAPLVLGVLSRGLPLGKTCADATYTRTDKYAPFLIETALVAAKRGGYAAPAWATGAVGDGGAEGGVADGGREGGGHEAGAVDAGRDAAPPPPPVDAGGSTVDAGGSAADAGAPESDAGGGAYDAGSSAPPAAEETPSDEDPTPSSSSPPTRSPSKSTTAEEDPLPEKTSSGCSQSPEPPGGRFAAGGLLAIGYAMALTLLSLRRGR